MIISGLGQREIPATCSDLIYVDVAERESGRILVVYNISWRIKFGEILQFAKFLSLQTFVVYGI